MSQLKCYIKPFNGEGEYTDWIEVTNDVDFDAMGSVTSNLEGSEYDVGVFTFSSVSLKLNNANSQYSDIDDINSMFRYKRANSKVKVTWQKGDHDAVCGFVSCDDATYPYYELPILEGLLNDEAMTSDLVTAQVSFKVLSYASIFKDIETPFSSMSNGDTFLEIIDLFLLNPIVAKTITIDLANVVANFNAIFDDISSYEDTTMSEVMDDLLLASNGVLYFEGDTIFVNSREATAEVQQTFYGQASNIGLENILSIDKIRSGRSRMFNLWRWEGTNLSSRDNTSIDDNGMRVKDFSIDSITVGSERQLILDSYRPDFQDIKMEFDMSVSIDTENVKLLDRVNIDYPTPYFAREGEVVARYAISKYGEAKYPFAEYGLTLSTTQHFKIVSVKIALKDDLIIYGLREI